MEKCRILNINCIGCRVCEQNCRLDAITITTDKYGFYKPQINNNCIKCGACERSCPQLKQHNEIVPLDGYYGWSKDESIRSNSSSGGAFTEIVNAVIEKNGQQNVIICASIFDPSDKSVHHVCGSYDDIVKFRKSKYVFSDVRYTFSEIKEYLEKEKTVIFCGTPCQVGALNSFLKKSYSNLLTIDFVCHGVPAQSFLKSHLCSIEKKYASKVTNVDFRPKTFGWRIHAIRVDLDNGKVYSKKNGADFYFSKFVTNKSLAPACYDCKYRWNTHESDFTIADFWAIDKENPKLDDNKGISLILFNTEQSLQILELLNNMKLYKVSKKHYNTLCGTDKKYKAEREEFLDLLTRKGYVYLKRDFYINRIFIALKKRFIKLLK